MSKSLEYVDQIIVFLEDYVDSSALPLSSDSLTRVAASETPGGAEKSEALASAAGSAAQQQPQHQPDYLSVIRAQNQKLVSASNKERALKNSVRNWDLFYKHNTTHAFADRHYLLDEVPELADALKTNHPVTFLEVGCGVGNALLPLLHDHPLLHARGLDCSARAIDLLRSHTHFDAARCLTAVCDVSSEDVPLELRKSADGKTDGVDVATLIFVLSAIQPQAMAAVLAHVWRSLRPGGVLYVRDYALHDMTQLRFKSGTKLDAELPWYLRDNGTRTFFFRESELANLLRDAGFLVLDCSCVRREVTNVKRQLSMRRVWIQARAQRPLA